MKKLLLTRRDDSQEGASLVEFIIVAPVIFIMGLGTLQAGLLYHNKSILNYATYEAARVGSTRHAQHKPMRRELGIRLAPIIGGDGSLKKAAIAMARTSTDVESVIGLTGDLGPPTMLNILSPDEAAFANWGKPSLEYVNRLVIPNSHLRHQGSEVRGGLSLQDANLLKIEVVHGVELKVPIVGPMLAGMMLQLIPDDDPHRLYYLSGKFPLKSTATIRMQSEAWKGAIDEARDKPYGEMVAKLEDIADEIEAAAEDFFNEDEEEHEEDDGCGEDGLGPSLAELVQSGKVCLARGYELQPQDYERQPCQALPWDNN